MNSRGAGEMINPKYSGARLQKFREPGGRLNLLGWRKAKNVEELLESLMCCMGKGVLGEGSRCTRGRFNPGELEEG
jgi:hypothetical protein